SFKILTGGGKELFSPVNRDPRFNADAACILIVIRRLDSEVFLPPTGQRRERITGGAGLVYDDRRRRSLLRGYLLFVGPSTVVGHRLAFEHLLVELVRIGGVRDRRVIDEHDDRLAFDIPSLEIIPAVFGGDDSITDEDQVRIFDPGFGRVARRAGQI